MIEKYKLKYSKEVQNLLLETKNFSNKEIEIALEILNSDDKEYYSYIYKLNKKIVGLLIFGKTPATSGTYDLYWIAVHPEHYGHGISQSLDEFATSFIKKHKGYLLIAETSGRKSYDRTRAFYIKQKYKCLTHIKDYYKKGEDLFVYGKKI